MANDPRSDFDKLCIDLALTTAEVAGKLRVPWRTVYRWRIGETKPSPMAQEKIEALRAAKR